MNKINLRANVMYEYARQQYNNVLGLIEDQINRGADGYLFPVKRLVSTDSPYSMNANDGLLICDTTGGSITINLLPARQWQEKRLSIKKIIAANTVTIDPNAAETIDGAATLAFTTQYQTVEIMSENGSVWIV